MQSFDKKIFIFLGIVVIIPILIVWVTGWRPTWWEKPQSPWGQEVTIVTDKTEYKLGEKIKVTINNNLETLIWGDFSFVADRQFRGLQRFVQGQWKDLNLSTPLAVETNQGGYTTCIFTAYEPQNQNNKLTAGSEFSYDLSLDQVCEWPSDSFGVPETEPKNIEKGTYRISLIYSVNENEDEVIYSNEFQIK